MLKNLQKRSQGFTIVEVMIVLAIAGLIILVVLLAVPALQRNSRNTTMKSDASSIAGAINEYSSANQGRMADTVECVDGTVTVSGGGTPVTGKIQGSTTCDDDGAMPDEPGAISVALGAKCDAAGTDIGDGSKRAAAVAYLLETSGDPTTNCLDS